MGRRVRKRLVGTLVAVTGIELALVDAINNHNIWLMLSAMAAVIAGLFIREYDGL